MLWKQAAEPAYFRKEFEVFYRMRYNKKMRNFVMESGFTLIELIIVLAIIAIIGAIIVPNFITGTDKARLISDIQSGKIIQTAVDLYEAEQGGTLDKDTIGSELFDKLLEAGYLRGSYTEPQTSGATWQYHETKKIVVLNIKDCSEAVKKVAATLSENEQENIVFS
ncbi:MAG: prepilin-type N-terminal cleavage/methylation domain-containing protein [Clostridiales bacterium]|jgi:prepilin-type N-terminal cleavage/methylation domain-containing protein|nr:prepilin-type N-terminal cleavage/methylation domain-containing protein [Clostridiales bacterium]